MWNGPSLGPAADHINFLGVQLKAGIATIALRQHDIYHVLDLAVEAGFAGVEIWGRPPHTPAEFDEEYTRQVRDYMRRKGLKASMFGSYANPCAPDYAQKSEDSIKIAKILGARIIRVWAGNKEPHEADDNLWTFVANALHDYALKAEDEGITLAMEMHGGTLALTPEGVLRLIEESKAPNLKLNYQVQDARNPDLERVIGMVGDHVVNVHAQNFIQSPSVPENMDLCTLEEGVIDYDRALALLAQHGFDGYVEVEFLKGDQWCEGTMLEALKKDAEYLKAVTAKYTS